ncbi:MAG: L-rhamnose mutarotase [Verrucomicrobiota bacterium]
MSPYENRLNAEHFRRVALIAEVPASNIDKLKDRLSQKPADLTEQLARAGLLHVHLYLQTFEQRTILFVYFEMNELDQEKSAAVFKQSSPYWATLDSLLQAHPRASETDAPWQRAEFINVIADNTRRDRSIGQPLGLAAGLHPDQELWYRTLHQTNWPGVIDQMARSHYQNWTTFMIEFDQVLMLFTHVEYIGSDRAADDELMKADPVTNRWWTHTEPCLYPLISGGGSWAAMPEQ